MYLTLVDTTGIQPYIFGSNRLQENIGGSYLVALATKDWSREVFRGVCAGTDRELYAGGGNYTALFDDAEEAESEMRAAAFERRLTRRAMEQAPGLQLLVVRHKCGQTLAQDLDAAFQEMAVKKAERACSAPLLGLSVTRSCASTGLPASHNLKMNNTPYEVSSETLAKVIGFHKESKEPIRDLAYKRLETMLSWNDRNYWRNQSYRFPRDFEELGRSKDSQSYIAVVHADGNGMGARIRKIGDKGLTDREYETELRAFSEAVDTASIEALKKTIKELIAVIEPDPKFPHKRRIAHPTLEMTVPLERNTRGRGWMLPFRPIVFGGDDVTFVCDGRLGISLATIYMKHLEEQTQNLPDDEGKLTACAGVAIVKSHYPFARAYALADELCRSAKKYRKETHDPNPNWDDSCLDWHFALGGLSGDIDTIREREFTLKSIGNLTQRPVSLCSPTEAGQEFRTWHFIKGQVGELQGEAWASKHNKVKLLREALRGGAEEVKKQKALFQLDTHTLNPPGAENGWHGKTCVLFDAIELADIYMPLNRQGAASPDAASKEGTGAA